MKKYIVLIEDDFEIMGNGSGDVASQQYLPAFSLMNIAKKHNVDLTFMVDVAHRLKLEEHANNPRYKLEANLWDDTILLMISRGFDVQLHIHPQWWGAKFERNNFKVTDNWNIGSYDVAAQEELISKSIEFLNNLICPHFTEYKVVAFKAGSWGLQPSENLLNTLKNHGIDIVMGVREGLFIPNQHIDYRNLEEAHFPYCPDFKDITKLSTRTNRMVIVPLQQYRPNLFIFSLYVLNKIKERMVQKRNKYIYDTELFSFTKKTLKAKNVFRCGFHPYVTHLKIGDTTFTYLKNSFDKVVRERNKTVDRMIPILIECHTKQIFSYYNDIDRFFGYLRKHYREHIEFMSLSKFNMLINKGVIPVKFKNKD